MTWAGDSEWAVGPKVAAVMGHLKAAGVVSVGMLGICWGGWVVCHASAAHPEARIRGQHRHSAAAPHAAFSRAI